MYSKNIIIIRSTHLSFEFADNDDVHYKQQNDDEVLRTIPAVVSQCMCTCRVVSQVVA